jgi:hypothetical protein
MRAFVACCIIIAGIGVAVVRVRIWHDQRAFEYVRSRGGSAGRKLVPLPALIERFWKLPRPEFTAEVLLHHEEVDDRVVELLGDCRQLEVLYLCGQNVDDRAIERIRHLPLQQVHVNASRVTDRGVSMLAGMPPLHHLQLNGTLITDAVLPELAAKPNLEHLTLRDTNVTDAGVIVFKRSASLRRLVLTEKISESTIREIADALPECYVSQ